MLEMLEVNIFLRPGRSHVRYWQKLVYHQIKVLFLRISSNLHTVWAFLSHIVEFETGSESHYEDEQEQLDSDMLINMESENDWLISPPDVYSVTISKFPTAVDFPFEIQGFKTKHLFNTGAQVSCISYGPKFSAYGNYYMFIITRCTWIQIQIHTMLTSLMSCYLRIKFCLRF